MLVGITVKLRTLPYRKVKSILEKNLFEQVPSEGGSHKKFFRVDNSGKKLIVIVPKHSKPIAKGTLSAIIKQSKKQRGEFVYA